MAHLPRSGAHAGRLLLALALAAGLALPSCDGRVADGSPPVEVRVQRVAVDEDSRTPVLILEELGGDRLLPIWIGFAEASSIASRLRDVRAIRPNTHDLAKRLIDELEGELSRVVVSDLADGIYYARIELERGGRTHEIDARPSDAIAIALRVGAPLFVREALFEEADALPGAEGRGREI